MPTSITKSKNIWTTLISILTTAKALTDTAPLSLGYVKQIQEGQKTPGNIPELPAIVATPISEREEAWSIPQYKKIIKQISLQCWLKALEKSTQISGEIELSDGSKKGIDDFVADVKNVINNHPDLDGNAMTLRFPTANNLFEVWPNQVNEIILEVDYLTLYNDR